MPHDRNGKEIKVGDIVKGKGFNLSHEIIGPAVAVNPNANSCNLTVATVKRISRRPHWGTAYVFDGEMVELCSEHGNCHEFEILKTGDGRALE